jgi:tetratricopeptide (TPR) repeat protein
LSADARQILKVIPIFATSASRAGIEAASDVHHFALDEALGQLVEMSLVDATDELDLAQRRYSVHPLTRAFATAKLQQEPEIQNAAQQRLAEFFHLFTEKHGGFWNLERFTLLEPDLPSILAIIQWCWEQQLVNLSMEIFHNVAYFMISRGYWNDVMNLGQQAVAKATELGDELGAARFQIWPVGWIHRHRGDLDKAEEHVPWAQAVFERLGEERDIALVKRHLGRIAQERGELERAEQLLREALAIYQAMGEEGLSYSITVKLASLALGRGDLDTAWTLSNDALAPVRRFGDQEVIAALLNVLGGVARQRGDLQQAKAFCEEALIYRRQAIRPDMVADALFELAQIEIEMGQESTARQKLLSALETYRRLDIQSKVQEVEACLAELPEPTDQTEPEEGHRAHEE